MYNHREIAPGSPQFRHTEFVDGENSSDTADFAFCGAFRDRRTAGM